MYTKKELLRMKFIYKALEDGWIVNKGKKPNTFEFIKSNDNFIHPKIKTKRSISEPIVTL